MVDSRGFRQVLALAPRRGNQQIKEALTSKMGDLAAQNAELEALVKQVLDRVSNLDQKIEGMQGQLTTNLDRADRLEARLEASVSPHQAGGKAPAIQGLDKHGPGDFLVHHAIALGLHTTTLILVKGALDADRKSTRLNSSHSGESRMPSSA